MSHTSTIGKTTFIHNGDFEGEVEVRNGDQSMVLPFADIKGIVAEFVRNQRIEKLEQASVEELLGEK